MSKTILGLLKKYFSIPFIQRMGITFIFGIVVGLLVGEPITIIEPLGTLFLRLLQMVVIPIIIFTLITAMKKIYTKPAWQSGRSDFNSLYSNYRGSHCNWTFIG